MYHLDPLGLVPLISSTLPQMKLRLRVRQFAEGSDKAEFRFVPHHSDTGFPGFVNSALVLEQNDRLRGIRQKAECPSGLGEKNVRILFLHPT